MPAVLDKARETISVGGTGALTLAGAVANHQTFAAATALNKPFYLWIKDGAAWEVGTWHLTTATNLVRLHRVESSTGADLNVSTSAEVYSEAPGNGLATNLEFVRADSGLKVIGGRNYGRIVTTSLTIAANSVYYLPYENKYSSHVDGFLVNVKTAGAAGAKLRVGLYGVGVDGGPNTLLIESADIDATTTGVKQASFTSQVLDDDCYYLGLLGNDATIAVLRHDSYAPSATTVAYKGTNLGQITNLTESVSSGWTAMPSPAGTVVQGGANGPVMFLRGV